MTERSDGVGRRGARTETAQIRWAAAAAAAGYAVWLAPAADAYIGPGAGMGVLGVLLAVVAALFMALVGMVLWPIRMVAHRRKARKEARDASAAGAETALAQRTSRHRDSRDDRPAIARGE